MSKYSLLFTLLFFILAVTSIITLVEVGAVSDNINQGLNTNPEFTIGGIGSFIGTYFKLLTFQVTSLPTALLFILSPIFIAINLIMIYYLADIIKDIIPFT
jgi:hypothetical protein